MKAAVMGLLAFFLLQNLYLLGSVVFSHAPRRKNHHAKHVVGTAEERCGMCASTNPSVCASCARRFRTKLNKRGCTFAEIEQICHPELTPRGSEQDGMQDVGDRALWRGPLPEPEPQPEPEPEPSSRYIKAPNSTAETVGALLDPFRSAALQPGVTLAVHGDVSRLGVMLLSRGLWNASVALAILVRFTHPIAPGCYRQ
jgi:hypothetical protein